ncbi:hypothetical protein F4680DRAFT_444846 [Xylaria scruposa]|nr:hypothetical protein F4680DRAFT_444846 [Xylaria scruposa]
MAFQPPTIAQDPTSVSRKEADVYNASIFAIRGLRTTATGNKLFYLTNFVLQNIEIPTFEPFYFFFYGPLQVPEQLRNVCGIKDANSIILRKNVSIIGWENKMWKQVPVLLPVTGGRVEGSAWLCEKPEHVAKICAYEHACQSIAYCDITVPSLDGLCTEVIKNARTFVNNRPLDELTDGCFDAEKYRLDLRGSW